MCTRERTRVHDMFILNCLNVTINLTDASKSCTSYTAGFRNLVHSQHSEEGRVHGGIGDGGDDEREDDIRQYDLQKYILGIVPHGATHVAPHPIVEVHQRQEAAHAHAQIFDEVRQPEPLRLRGVP